MKKCKLVQNIMNFKFCYIIFCRIICFIVLSVPTSAKENSDNVIRVGSFEETYNVANEKGERSGYGYEYLQDIAGYAGIAVIAVGIALLTVFEKRRRA